jgi:SAM-dependent methyltransferase
MTLKERFLLIKHSIACLGLVETLSALGHYALRARDSADFDKKYSTDTTTRIAVDNLEISDPEARRRTTTYRSAPERFIQYLINHLDIDYREYDFVDIGCGKGRVLLVASNFTFRSISGIEISPPAYAAAMKNLKIYKSSKQRCFNIQVSNQDAQTYEPIIANTVYYFFEPFDKFILANVLFKISSKLKDQGKTIYIVSVWSNLAALIPFINKLGFQTVRYHKMLDDSLTHAIFVLNGR